MIKSNQRVYHALKKCIYNKQKTFLVLVVFFLLNVRFFDRFSLSFRDAQTAEKACRIIPIEVFPLPAKMSKMKHCIALCSKFAKFLS